MDTRQLIASFMSPEAGQQRRAWLERQAGNLSQYVPPELRRVGSAAAELNPVTSMERAGQASQTMFAPGTSGWGRVGAAGDMLSNVAGVVAPGVAAKGSAKTAQAIEEMLLGASMPQREALRQFAGDDSGALRLFHGSPHDFDKFSMDKIGTGEGAQAYGHGLYFAEKEAVAQGYQTNNSATAALRYDGKPITDETKKSVAWYLEQNDGNKEAVIEQWRAMYKPSYFDSPLGRREMRALEKMDPAKLKAGNMYEVNVNANPEDFLDWDAPLSAQPEVARRLGLSTRSPDAINDEAYELMMTGPGGKWMEDPAKVKRAQELQDELDNVAPPMTGQEYYRGGSDGDVSNILSRMGYGNPEAQTQALRDKGIPGIKYLDAGSRGAGDGSRNYVVFDENLISIVRKYGIAGAAAMLGMSQADVASAAGMDAATGQPMAMTPPRAP
jgi:hypothetical protein